MSMDLSLSRRRRNRDLAPRDRKRSRALFRHFLAFELPPLPVRHHLHHLDGTVLDGSTLYYDRQVEGLSCVLCFGETLFAE